MNSYYFDPCCKSKTDKKIVLKDKGKTKGPQFIGRNPNNKEILEVNVDHCLPIEGKKCDYLLISKNENTAHFIELKGNKIKDALEQLENSIQEISNPGKGFISKNFNHNFIKWIIFFFVKISFFIKLSPVRSRKQKYFSAGREEVIPPGEMPSRIPILLQKKVLLGSTVSYVSNQA